MRRIDMSAWWGSDKDLQAWWTSWLKEANDATTSVIHLWETSGSIDSKSFDAKVWGVLKEKLLEHVFHGKCAYCETHIRGARQSGHGEHFRPKLTPNYRDAGDRQGPTRRAMTRSPTGEKIAHPGYFWLAYDWRNLVPSCERCNTGGGKNNQFPLGNMGEYTLLVRLPPEEAAEKNARESETWRGFFYLPPREMDNFEDPQLVHPYYDEPQLHMGFDELGNIFGKSERGWRTIHVLNLDDDDLTRERQETQERVINRIYAARMNATAQGYRAGVIAGSQELVDAVKGKVKFSQAVLAASKMHKMDDIVDAAREACHAEIDSVAFSSTGVGAESAVCT